MKRQQRMPLQGIRVLDMTAVWAGPFTTLLLGDLGAEVICVESLQHFPRSVRGWLMRPSKEVVAKMGIFSGPYVDRDPGKRPWNRHANFNSLGRNKLSMTVDLKRPRGRQLFYRLAGVSDILVSNFASDTLGRLGVGYETLSRINPGIIVINMPAFGNSGPFKDYVATGNLVEGASGFTSLRGYRDLDKSMNSPVFHMDGATGPGGVLAVTCALMDRRRTGLGQFIDLSQQENMLPHLGEYFMDYQMNQRIHAPIENRDLFGAIQGCYPCRGDDEWVVLTLRNDPDWAGLVHATGEPAWAKDARFQTSPSRLEHHDALDEAIASWTREHTAQEVTVLLQRQGVPAGPVLDERAAYADPHLRARGFFIRLRHHEAGTHEYPGYLWKYEGAPPRDTHPAPCLGEHNGYVYREILGISETEYRELEREGHVGTEYV